ncbi:hypothetical protein M758_UG236500 [Ceratodon purpureus]|nr:hypothetical protein M758_UG236500 [Ceratodon purpureus]
MHHLFGTLAILFLGFEFFTSYVLDYCCRRVCLENPRFVEFVLFKDCEVKSGTLEFHCSHVEVLLEFMSTCSNEDSEMF